MIVKEKRKSLGRCSVRKDPTSISVKEKQVYRLSKDVQDAAQEGVVFKTRTLKSFKS